MLTEPLLSEGEPQSNDSESTDQVGTPPPISDGQAARGTVKWFNEKKGFGFIVDPSVPGDIFVHFSAIRADGFRTLNEGDMVTYELYQDDKGAKARNVVRVE